jgi:iron complex outermembrane receptor protein
VPIDVISAETLTQSGFTETNRLLNQQVPSFNFPQPAITDGTDVVRPATLRGLSPDQTLVLINGKRRHTTALLNINGSVGRGSAAVDINLIPSIALSRVEVLRDGAAAQYGSDAIAGVLNFQLSDRRQGGRIQVNFGTYITNVGNVEEVTGLATGANGQPTLAADGTYNLVTTGEDRHVEDGETVTAAAIFGLPLGAEGHLTVSAEYQYREPTNRAGYDPRRQFNLIGGLVDPRELTLQPPQPPLRRSADAGREGLRQCRLPLGEAIELYSFAPTATATAQSAAFYRLANDARNVPAIYPNGFLPLINTELEDYGVVAGVRGDVGGFRYDLSGNRAENHFDFLISNTLNRSLGAASPTRFDAGGLRYSQTMANLDVSREFAVGSRRASALPAASNIATRRSDSRWRAELLYRRTCGGASGRPGLPRASRRRSAASSVDSGAQRHNVSAYAELDADVTTASTSRSPGRYEDYSDFGSDWNGKVAGRFEPVEAWPSAALLHGFRAPSLQQQFYARRRPTTSTGSCWKR